MRDLFKQDFSCSCSHRVVKGARLYFGHYNGSRLEHYGLITNHKQFFGLITNHELDFEAITDHILCPITYHDKTLYHPVPRYSWLNVNCTARILSLCRVQVGQQSLVIKN